MRVPLLDLQLQYQSLKSEIEPVLLKVAESQALILGKEVTMLEETLANYCGSKFALGVSSGTDALLMALMALNLSPDDEVIMPTYSFFATAGVVARLRAKPIFVDSEPITLNIDPSAIRVAITPRTKAIIPVHLYGQSANMDEILAIGEEYGIPIIEDAAQAIGAQYENGKPVGSMGLMGCFSFYPTKNLGAFGDAGLLTTNDEKLYKYLRQMRDHGMEPRYYHKFVGGNFRMDAIQAAVLNVKFTRLESWHFSRRKNAALYCKLFIENGLADSIGITNFSTSNQVLLPLATYETSGVTNFHIYNQFIIRVERRDELRDFLKSHDIGAEIYYPVPFHRQECFEYLQNNDSNFPVANFAAATSLALPIFPELKPEQIRFVVEKIREFVRSN